VIPRSVRDAKPGTLIAAAAVPGRDRMLGSARRWRVLYHSRDLAGRDTVVSGLVLLPAGRAPREGWSVIAWAHGTTGLADQCAPSLAPELGHDPSAVAEVRGLLAHHWAVVATDYPGLGTPGVHPYLVGHVNAHAVIDAVTAAHELLGTRLSPRWVTVGHSQGGQTALFTAQDARQRAPRWDYRGAVALAPASHLDALIALVEATHDPTEQAYLIYALAGLGTVDPTVQLSQLLTVDTQAVAHDLADSCIDPFIADLENRKLAQVLDADPATLDRLRAELGHYDNPDQQYSNAPVLIAQGTEDQDVPAGATDGLVSQLCDHRDHVEYRRYPGLDHEGVVTASLPYVVRWINDRLAGRDTPNTCQATNSAP
jgi:pimeloyl-ACP methyl ester carboxylesterase